MTGKSLYPQKIALFLLGVLSASAQPGTEGHVNYMEFTASWYDQYTDNPTPAIQSWFQTHMQEMVVWSPYFDTRTSWFPNALPYTNLFGILQGSWVQYAHPEWILKDQYGNWLYIPFSCFGGTCANFAGDIANPAFRAWWISTAQSTMQEGNYPGIYIDDVDMDFRVSDGNYNEIQPIDSNTGQLMSQAAWRNYIAQFTSEIRSALPYANIVQNVVWYADSENWSDPPMQQQISSATRLYLERGVASDPGLTGGTGFWSVYSFFNFVDQVHALGRSVDLGEYGLSPAGQEYGLASYFMVSNGNDSVGDSTTTPYNWFNGYSVDLGPALGQRTYNNGVFQRNFTNGMVLMGEPSLGSQTISLPNWFQRLDGTWVNSVTLSGSQGIILIGSTPPPPPPPTGGTQWTSLGGGMTGRAAIGANADGRLEAFVRGNDNALWHRWQNSPGGAWSAWNSLGGTIAGNPTVVSNADGRLEVFVSGLDSGLWHVWQTSPGGSWSGFAGLGGVLQNDPSVVANADGRLEVFVEGSDGGLWHIAETSAGGSWAGWSGLGGGLNGRPAPIKNADGRLEVLVRGSDNGLWHLWQTYPGGGWSGWSSLGGAIGGTPAVALNTDGRVEAVVFGMDGALWHIWQNSAGGSWAAWNSLGGTLTSDPTVASNTDGRLEVFARGADNALWHTWQNWAGGTWSNWSSLGGVLSNQAVAGRNSDGRLDVFVQGSDSALWHVAQSSAGNW